MLIAALIVHLMTLQDVQAVWQEKALAPWQVYCEQWGATYQIDSRVLGTIIVIESRGRADAPEGASGEVGLMQVIPGDVLGDANRPDSVALRDPETNIGTGAAILRQYTDYFDGRLRYGIAAYNIGPAWLKEIGISHELPQYYLRRFREVWQELWPGEPLPWLTSDRLLQPSPEDEGDIGGMDWFLPPAEAIGVTTEPSGLKDGYSSLIGAPDSWLAIGGFR